MLVPRRIAGSEKHFTDHYAQECVYLEFVFLSFFFLSEWIKWGIVKVAVSG